MTAGRPLLVYRAECNGVPPGPVRPLLGVWLPTGEIIATIDLVAHGTDATLNEGAYVGCDVLDVNTDRKAGRIKRHAGLRTPNGEIVPVVVIEPEAGMVETLHIFRWTDPALVRLGDRVRVLFSVAIEGSVTRGVVPNDTRFVRGVPMTMPLFEVTLDSAQFQRSEWGAPVVPVDDPDQLLGMVVSVPKGPPHDGCLARCYPAAAGFGP